MTNNLYNFIIRNKCLFKELDPKEISKNKTELERMTINDALFLFRKFNDKNKQKQLGGTLGKRLSSLMKTTQQICSISAQSILYNYRGLITSGEMCYIIKDVVVENYMNLEDSVDEYRKVFEQIKKGGKTFIGVKPDDLKGYVVHTHGGLISDEKTHKFEIPNNTFIIHLTELGKFGQAGSSTMKLLELLGNKKIVSELLYLIMYEHRDTEFNNFTYFKDRIIYGPFSNMPDSIIGLSDFEKVDCLEYFGILDKTKGLYKDPPDLTPDKVTLMEVPYGMGIYECPIQGINDTTAKKVYVNYKDKITNQIIRDKRPLDEMLKVNPNLEYYIEDIPYYFNQTSSIVEHSSGNYLYTSGLYSKLDEAKTKADYVLKNPDWSFKEDGKYYSCSAKMFDKSTPKTFETISDITLKLFGAKKDDMRFSELITYLRNEADKKYGPQQKIVILTGQCRSFGGLSDEFTSGCLKLENSAISLMNMVELTDEEELHLWDSFDNLKREYSISDLKLWFSQIPSGPNVTTTQIKVRKPKKPKKL